MSTLRNRIRDIQRAVGVTADGIFGPLTAGAVMRSLNACEPGGEDADSEIGGPQIDPRTAENIAELDPKCRERFERFSRLAEATAAAMGCDYRMISSFRSWDEQTALYAKGRTAPGDIVTYARAGHSWHNFRVAGDYGVFRGSTYLDNTDPILARRVHIACAAHAAECGLEWGGEWRSFQDIPHYHVRELPSSPTSTHRKLWKERGTVL